MKVDKKVKSQDDAKDNCSFFAVLCVHAADFLTDAQV